MIERGRYLRTWCRHIAGAESETAKNMEIV